MIVAFPSRMDSSQASLLRACAPATTAAGNADASRNAAYTPFPRLQVSRGTQMVDFGQPAGGVVHSRGGGTFSPPPWLRSGSSSAAPSISDSFSFSAYWRGFQQPIAYRLGFSFGYHQRLVDKQRQLIKH